MEPSGEMSHVATAHDQGQGVFLHTEHTLTPGFSAQAPSSYWGLAGICTHQATCVPHIPTGPDSAGDSIYALK